MNKCHCTYPFSQFLEVYQKSLLRLVSVCSIIQLCPVLCEPMDSSVHGIFQARILEWVAISSSWGSSQPRDQTHVSWVSCLVGSFFTAESLNQIKVRIMSVCPLSVKRTVVTCYGGVLQVCLLQRFLPFLLLSSFSLFRHYSEIVES